MLSGNQKLLTKTLTGLLYPVIPRYFIPFWLPFDAFCLKTLGVHLNAEWQSIRGIMRVQHHGASSCSTALEVYVLAMLPHIFFLKKNENCLST